MSSSPAIGQMAPPVDTPAPVATPRRPGKMTSGARALRWGARILAVALIGLNAWWAWGDRAAPEMKRIDASIARGAFDDAERALRERLRWSPADGDARMKLARLLGRRGDSLACARELHRVAHWWPAKAEASFLEGQAFKAVDRARDAEAAWRVCIADDPLHPVPPVLLHGAARELVVLSILEGRIEEARRVIWRAYDAATLEERPGVLIMRLRAELERVAHEEAVVKLRKYVAADPEDWDARRALALEEQAIGDGASADRDLDACLRARPDDPLAWRARLEILQQRGDAEATREAIGRLPATTQGDARVWMYRGIARQSDGDLLGAFEDFRRSDRLGPDDPETLFKLGTVESRLGRPGPAREHLARSRQLYKSHTELREAYLDFVDQHRKAPRDPAAYRSAVERLATTCRQLGWAREADAWKLELAGG